MITHRFPPETREWRAVPMRSCCKGQMGAVEFGRCRIRWQTRGRSEAPPNAGTARTTDHSLQFICGPEGPRSGMKCPYSTKHKRLHLHCQYLAQTGSVKKQRHASYLTSSDFGHRHSTGCICTSNDLFYLIMGRQKFQKTVKKHTPEQNNWWTARE